MSPTSYQTAPPRVVRVMILDGVARGQARVRHDRVVHDVHDDASQVSNELDSLREEVMRLKAENSRLKEELRRAARAQHETPPHYL